MSVKWNKSWVRYGVPESYKNYKGAFRGKVDLHIHSRFSDANPDIPMDTIGQISKYCGFSAVSLTDHETYEGFREFFGVCKKYKVPVIPGFELNVLVEGKYAIEVLAYGFDLDNKSLPEMLMHCRRLEVERLKVNVKRVNDNLRAYQTAHQTHLNFPRMLNPGEKAISDEFVESQLKRINDGRNVHMGDIVSVLLKDGFFPEANIEGHFKNYFAYTYFSGLQVKREEMNLLPIDEAIKIIHQANGYVFMAHDFGKIHSAKEVAKHAGGDPRELILRLLNKHGFDGIEMIHSDFSSEDIKFNMETAKNMGLKVSGGSDTHWDPMKRHLVIGISPEKALGMQEWMKGKLF